MSVKFYTKYNRKPCCQCREKISPVDNIDRTSYISLETQYLRLMSAGATLQRQYSDQYNFEYQDVVDSMNTPSFLENIRNQSLLNGRFMTKQDAHDKMLDRYKQYTRVKEEHEKLRKNYDDWLKEKELRNKAINDYKNEQYTNIQENQK